MVMGCGNVGVGRGGGSGWEEYEVVGESCDGFGKVATGSMVAMLLHFRITLKPLTASHRHCTAGSSRSFAAIRKDAGLYCGPRLQKGEVFAYVGRNQNLKDLKDFP